MNLYAFGMVAVTICCSCTTREANFAKIEVLQFVSNRNLGGGKVVCKISAQNRPIFVTGRMRKNNPEIKSSIVLDGEDIADPFFNRFDDSFGLKIPKQSSITSEAYFVCPWENLKWCILKVQYSNELGGLPVGEIETRFLAGQRVGNDKNPN